MTASHLPNVLGAVVAVGATAFAVIVTAGIIAWAVRQVRGQRKER